MLKKGEQEMEHNNESCELLEKVQPHEQANVDHFGPIYVPGLCFSGAESIKPSCYTRMDSVVLK